MRLGLIAAAFFVFLTSAASLALIVQNSRQKNQIQEIERQSQTRLLEINQIKKQLEQTAGLRQSNTALKEEITDQISLIESMRRPLPAATQLPAELISLLNDWAINRDLATFEPNSGIVRFKSSMLFRPGSDELESTALNTVKSLIEILNNTQARKFDIIIAGHTDNQPIKNPRTIRRHPTNMHLSVHRAISVFNIMANSGVAPERMSVRGFGEYRPIVPNEQNSKKGTPQNRRIEIHIVPKGV